ncbi:MAG: hypothetical protein KAF40_08050, partial [Flavihumibacter sp.]|nr:hypothetical protein [Flavihumibacter sp.]
MRKNNTLSRFLKTSYLLMAVGVLVSCQKEIDPLNENEPGQEVVPTNESYFPLTKGSRWLYKDSLLNISSWGSLTGEKKTVNS